MSETCHECGGPVIQERGPQSVQVGERFVTVEAEYLRCTACGEIVFHLRQAEAMERAAVDIVRREEELLSPGEIEAIRARHGLSQAAFEQLIHVGPKTVTRWERGSVAPNGTADILLRILRDEPGVVERLAREQGVTIPLEPDPQAAAGMEQR